jgi:site-specific recombinase XerD
VSPNDLRHSAASFAIDQGANVYHVQRMLGHAKPSITLDVYGELWDDSMTALAKRLDSVIRSSGEVARSSS